MKTALTLLTAVILCLFTSCEKDDRITTVSGRVIEQGSDEPVDSALVRFSFTQRYTYNVTESPIDSLLTGPDGTYSFRKNMRKLGGNEGLLVYANAKGYFDVRPELGASKNVEISKTQTRNLTLIPYAWVRIHCLHTEGNDRMFINPPVGSKNVTGTSVYDNTTLYSRVYGNQIVEIHTFYYRNGARVDKKTYTVNSIAHDTVDITINF